MTSREEQIAKIILKLKKLAETYGKYQCQSVIDDIHKTRAELVLLKNTNRGMRLQ